MAVFFSSCPSCLSVVNYYSFCMSQEKSIVFWTISKKCLSDKDYGLISMNQDTVFNMPGHSTCKHNPLNMSANTSQVIHTVAMTHPVNILLDDWSSIQFLCYIMCRSSDQLDPALKSLCIRISTRKGRQEAVMDINDAIWII